MSVKLRRADGGGASFGGESFEPNEAGVIEVPGEAVGALLDHGFEVVRDEPKKSEKSQAEVDQEVKLAELLEAVKTAKAALKGDKENAEKKAAFDQAVEALKAAKG